jgi:D-ribose pyranase
MKKTPLINIALSRVIASLGHGDRLVIGDAGMPVPAGVELIDLALTRGIPAFVEVLQAVLAEMQVESHVVAEEMVQRQLPPWQALEAAGSAIGQRRVVSHEALKELTREARAFVRTGEYTPYANVMLVAGVTF